MSTIPNIPPLTPPQPQHQPSHPHPHPHPPTYDLDLTIISAKHLKNVNWRTGTLKPYAIFWVDPDNKLTTKSDDSGDTKPVWNQKFSLPVPTPLPDSTLSLELFHSKTLDTNKPFIGSVVVPLSDLPDPTNPSLLRSFDVLRPSGRPQGKLKLRISIKQHVPDYQNAPQSGYYYSSAPPYPRHGSGYPYSGGLYSGYYFPPPTVFPRREGEFGVVGRGAMPSAPSSVGPVAGALGGLALDEERRSERVEDRESVAEYYDYRGGADF